MLAEASSPLLYVNVWFSLAVGPLKDGGGGGMFSKYHLPFIHFELIVPNRLINMH